MGSGVLLAALVVLWFVVLVPMVVTRGDAQGGQVGLADSGRTLQRRRAVDPVVHADTERVSIDRDLLRTSGELQVDVHALRRRTLAGMAALAALALVGALVYSPWLWVAQGLLDVAVVGYLLVLRKAARRERLGFRQEGLLRRYLDIDGDWRDHLAYALLAEDLPGGVLARWQERVPR